MPTNSSLGGWQDVVGHLPDLLGRPNDWLVSGSCAVALHGLAVVPKDIDVWCLPERLQQLAERFGREIEHRTQMGFVLESFCISLDRWSVEVAGRAFMPGGIVMSVDRDMLASAGGNPLVESVPDLLAELLTLDRSAPKADFQRAKGLATAIGSSLDWNHVRIRMERFAVPRSRIEMQIIRLQRECQDCKVAGPER